MGEEADGFTKVDGNKGNSAKKRRLEANNNLTISLQNKFTPLQNKGTEMIVDDQEHEKKTVNATKTPSKAVRVPPIIQYVKIDLKTALVTFQKLCKSEVRFKFPNDTSVNIYATTREDYEKVIHFLQHKEHKFFTYTPEWSKIKQVVLKGLPKIDEATIEEELKEKGFNCKVTVIKKKEATMPDFSVRLVTVSKQFDLKKLFKIKHLCSTIIKWEPYVNKKGVTQCHRCQKFGHGTRNCNLTPRCIKCGQQHLTEACSKEKDDPPKCANCEGVHPASYNQCPKVIEHLNKMK